MTESPKPAEGAKPIALLPCPFCGAPAVSAFARTCDRQGCMVCSGRALYMWRRGAGRELERASDGNRRMEPSRPFPRWCRAAAVRNYRKSVRDRHVE